MTDIKLQQYFAYKNAVR